MVEDRARALIAAEKPQAIVMLVGLARPAGDARTVRKLSHRTRP